MRLGIRQQESGGDYKAHNPKAAGGDGAYGAYQFLNATWRGYGFDTKYGAARADLATPAQQDEAAMTALAQVWANPKIRPDYERLIAAWFAGEGPLVYGDKKYWDQAPPGTSGYNPAVRAYVDGVLAHIKEIS